MPGERTSLVLLRYCNVEKNYENLQSSFRFSASFLSRGAKAKDNAEVLPLDGEREWSILIAP